MGKRKKVTQNYRKTNEESYSRGYSSRGRNNYPSHKGYSKNNGRYFPNKRWKRPLSPVEGSEEFMALKIQKTSAIIMRQLLSPNEPMPALSLSNKDNKEIEDTTNESIKPKENKDKQSEKGSSKMRRTSTSEINVKEIHEKIMSRLTNLNDGRKKNFINAQNNSILDSAIQHIHKQKRLELSRVLRDMCSSSPDLQKSGEIINSIIPDIGIKIEELPIDVIQELRQTLNLDLEEDILDPASPTSHFTKSSADLNIAIDSTQVNIDLINSLDSCDTIEIKQENPLDFNDIEENNQDTLKEIKTTQIEMADNHQTQKLLDCPFIKEEPQDGIDGGLTNFSGTTVVFPDVSSQCEVPEVTHRDNTENDDVFREEERLELNNERNVDFGNNQNDDNRINSEDASSQTDSSLSSVENFINQFMENDTALDMNDFSEISERVDLVDRCIKYLSRYRTSLVQSVIKYCIEMQGLNRNEEGDLVHFSSHSGRGRRNVTNRIQSSDTIEEGVGISQNDSLSNDVRYFSSHLSQTRDNTMDRLQILNRNEIAVGISQNETLSNDARCSSNLISSSRENMMGRLQGLNKHGQGVSISQNETLSSDGHFSNQSSQTRENMKREEDKRATKRRKVMDSAHYSELQDDVSIKSELDDEEVQDFLTFPKLDDRVMVVERVDNQLILATEAGNIIYVSLKDGTFLHTLAVTSSPITSVVFLRGLNDFIYMYIGSLDRALRIYDFKNRNIIKATNVDDHIRCMDVKWDYVFMGCKDGTLIRYSSKKSRIEFEQKNTGADILVIKAAQEGPRRVLIIGHKHAPIYVRDAMSGLHLRNFINEAITPTVYALIINNNLLYCGTAQNNILVFSFHEGHLLHKLYAADCKGISCMKIHKDLLFSGCYNGSIYVYDLKVKRLLETLEGPGGGILCMEVLNNQVIVGTLKGRFGSVLFPPNLIKN